MKALLLELFCAHSVLLICCSLGELLELPGPTIQVFFGTLLAAMWLEPSITSSQLTPTPMKWCENGNILHSNCTFSGTC